MQSSLRLSLSLTGADVIAIAKEAGFSITTEDLKEDRQTLSDTELESVAGGGGWGGWTCGDIHCDTYPGTGGAC